MTSSCENVYRERTHLLALLATIYPSHLQFNPNEPDWPVLFLHLPTGQCTWHISEEDLDLLGHVRTDMYESWDGHTTDEKYERVDRLTRDQALSWPK